jgi:hypothetical protein
VGATYGSENVWTQLATLLGDEVTYECSGATRRLVLGLALGLNPRALGLSRDHALSLIETLFVSILLPMTDSLFKPAMSNEMAQSSVTSIAKFGKVKVAWVRANDQLVPPVDALLSPATVKGPEVTEGPVRSFTLAPGGVAPVSLTNDLLAKFAAGRSRGELCSSGDSLLSGAVGKEVGVGSVVSGAGREKGRVLSFRAVFDAGARGADIGEEEASRIWTLSVGVGRWPEFKWPSEMEELLVSLRDNGLGADSAPMMALGWLVSLKPREVVDAIVKFLSVG